MKLKSDRRTIFGVGPKWLSWSLLLSSPVITIAVVTHPKFVIDSSIMVPFRITGALLATAGFVLYVISIRTMFKAFNQNELVTTGVYGLSRNPIYSALIFATLPGLFLFFGMPLLLLIPLIMYGVLSVTLKQEESELLDVFGEEYNNYRNRVNTLFPFRLFKAR